MCVCVCVFTQDIADLERRCHGAETRHQELTAKLPDATRPLLRQIEAMQAAADAQAGAWAAAEQSLTARIEDAEGRAAAAAERERHVTERLQVGACMNRQGNTHTQTHTHTHTQIHRRASAQARRKA